MDVYDSFCCKIFHHGRFTKGVLMGREVVRERLAQSVDGYADQC